MFVSVLFGEGRREIFNLNCRIANFIQCLKEKCNVDPQESVDLMDKTGELVNLSEKEQSVHLASTLLKERQIYILIRVSRSNSTDGHKYYPLLSDLGRSHPELAEVLRKLSNPIKERDRKGAHLKKGGVIQNKNKCGANNKKSVVTTPRS
ncbi:uncharacterized protein C22orf15 [Chanos chanos]|uniref:Uncharacterized protein C22orf15 n=1 Tax=Chanos chanos TaxID=29144 RepID=A0A6J2UM26_CHACN|nr:uncharacterized protein C22orf15 homolog [Chanos chanos]